MSGRPNIVLAPSVKTEVSVNLSLPKKISLPIIPLLQCHHDHGDDDDLCAY